MLNFSVNNKCKSKQYNSKLFKLFTIANNEIGKQLKIKKDLFFDVILLNNAQMKKINFKYRKINKVTDVITFALWDAKNSIKTPLLGEIFLCFNDIATKAKKQKNNLITQIVFTYIHGVLHLLGYDHISKKDEKIMFNLQDKILMRVMKHEN